jgi:hypothetical protein
MTSDLLHARRNMDWKNYVIPKVIQKLDEYTFAPTIRGMFYNLASDGIISNTVEHYKGLDAALVDARKAGRIPIDAFVDNTRRTVEIEETYWSAQDLISYYVDKLKSLPEEYFSTDNIPRWYKQTDYVEVWLEKDAVKGTFQSILKDRHVRIVPNRGWSSLSFLNENIQRLLKKQKEGKIIHVLYFGDFDPSGLAMAKKLARDLNDELGPGYTFERIALTKSQIRDFRLEHLKSPFPEVLEKLKKDRNADSFVRENGDLYQIEIDALQKNPQKFKKLVLAPVDRYFDQRVYDDVMAEFTPEDIERLVLKQVQFNDGARPRSRGGDT